jgi:aromatic ring-opening dioxygenase LigB subunit
MERSDSLLKGGTQLGLIYGCVVPHSPNLVPQVGGERARECARTREAMTEIGMVICEEKRIPNCVIVSPHSPFLPEAFGVWEGKKLKGSMERFQAPDVTLTLRVSTDLAEAIVDVAGRMELPIGRLNKDWELDRGVTVPAVFLLRADETKVVPVAISMLGWDEHWLFGTAIAKAADQLGEDVVLVASSNLSHRITPDAPHGYSGMGAEFDGLVREAFNRGQLRELLDIPQDLCREASECGFAPLLVLGGAFDGKNVKGRVLSYEAPFGIGYLVAEVSIDDEQREPMPVAAATAERVSGALETLGEQARGLFRRRSGSRR